MKRIISISIFIFILETALHACLIGLFNGIYAKDAHPGDTSLYAFGYVNLKLIFYLIPYLIMYTFLLRKKPLISPLKTGLVQVGLFAILSLVFFYLVQYVTQDFDLLLVPLLLSASLITPPIVLTIITQGNLKENILMSEDQEFWEKSFIDKQEMWGFSPAESAVLARDLFKSKSLKNILVPGIGYGRNAQIFADSGMNVTGIEISKTAIDMARKHYGPGMTIFQGSVTDMPFDNKKYDGIFCYALIHLLNEDERMKLIRDCYDQLIPGGYMVFTAISKEAHTYGTGTFISKDRYEIFEGVKMFFYDEGSIHAEFDQAGLLEITPITESQPFFLIKCRKDPSRASG